MRKIKIICPKNHTISWLQEGQLLMEKKLKPLCKLEIINPKDQHFSTIIQKTRDYWALDPCGKMHSSISFSTLLCKKSSCTFVIGPSDGLSNEQKQGALDTISLSKMTFTHQHTKVILLEQIYRALQINRNSPYHK